MPNIKISDLETIAPGFDPDQTFVEVLTTVAGELSSRKASATEITAGAGPLAADYVTVTPNAILPNERILAGDANIDITDGGAGANITVSMADMPQATVKGRAVGAGTGIPIDLTASQINDILAAGGFATYFSLSATNRVIGSNAGTNNTGDNVFLASALAGDNNIADGVIAIGQNAFAAAVQLDFAGSIAIGRNAGALLDDTRDPWLIIGDGAVANLPGQSFHDGNTVIGTNALGALAANNIQGATVIGHDACSDMTGASGLGTIGSSVVIGFDAGRGNVGASISNCVFIGRGAGGDLGIGGATSTVAIGLNAGESMGGANLNVIIGSSAAPNAINIDTSIILGCNTAAFGVAQTAGQIIIGHSSIPGILTGETNILIGNSQGITGTQLDFDHCIIIGHLAGNEFVDDQDIFAIEQPQGNTSSLARPYLFGNMLNGNLALLNIAAMTGGTELGTRILPAWADAAPTAGQGVFSMYGAGTDLAATTDADFVHFFVASADSALTLRYPLGGDVTLLHDGTDSIIANSAGAMRLNGTGAVILTTNSVEGLRLVEDNSGVLQVPAADVAITAFAGGGQGSATPLTQSYNVVAVSATFNDSVRLPDVFATNSIVIVKNDGANRVAIFPASGDDLGEGVDTLISLPVGSSYSFIATAADSTWTLLDTNIATALLGLNNNGPQIADIQPSDVIPTILPNKVDADSGLGWLGSDIWDLIAGGVQALQFRELAGGVIQAPSATLGITAFAGGGQGSAVALIDSYNVITVVATTGDSVRLPSIFSANALVTIKNDDATEAADVFPASGDDLGAGVDTAVSIAAGETLAFIGTLASSTWTPILPGGGQGTLTLVQANTPTTPALAFGDGDSGFFEESDDTITVTLGGTAHWDFNFATFRGNSGVSMVDSAPTATAPNIRPGNADNNTGIGSAAADQLSLIAGGIEMLRLVETGVASTDQILLRNAGVGGAAATPLLAFGDGDTGFFESLDDTLQFTSVGVARFAMSVNGVLAINSDAFGLLISNATATAPTLLPSRGDADTGIGANGPDELSLIAGAVEGMRLTELSSGVVQAPSASVAVTAFATGGQGSATALVNSYNVITVVGTDGDSVRLPDTFAVNSVVYVKNDDSAQAADVFPASGDNLGAGVDTAVSLLAGESVTFIATVANSTWTPLIVATGGGGAGADSDGARRSVGVPNATASYIDYTDIVVSPPSTGFYTVDITLGWSGNDANITGLDLTWSVGTGTIPSSQGTWITTINTAPGGVESTTVDGGTLSGGVMPVADGTVSYVSQFHGIWDVGATLPTDIQLEFRREGASGTVTGSPNASISIRKFAEL